MAPENDTAGVDEIVSALYETISHEPGSRPDWERMRRIFADGARLIPPAGPDGVARQISLDEFIEKVEESLEAQGGSKGFLEAEVSRRTEAFGRVVHAWSTYESRRTAEDVRPFARGINSIQMVKTNDGWRIVTVLWDAETPESPIPERYLSAREAS